MTSEPLPFDDLPGGDLIRQGLEDLERGVESIEALLVLVGAPNLRDLGLEVPLVTDPLPEHRLYRLLAQTEGDAAHGAYNALIRRLVSFERAAACVLKPTPSA